MLNQSEVDISLSPSGELFDVHNMKPGDWAPRDITIKNMGKKDFTYQMFIQNEGEEKLFYEFILEVQSMDNMIYNGRLAEFEGFPKRFLAREQSEKLTITLRFPEHLGNEFQGHGADFTITFVAEAGGDNTPTPPGDPGEEDPGEDPGENPGEEDPGEDPGENPGEDPGDDSGGDPGEEDPDDDGGNTPVDNDSNDDAGKGTDDKDMEQVSGSINNGNSSGGSELPNTAADMYNYLFIGGYLLLAGVIILLVSKRKKSVNVEQPNEKIS